MELKICQKCKKEEDLIYRPLRRFKPSGFEEPEYLCNPCIDEIAAFDKNNTIDRLIAASNWLIGQKQEKS